MNCTLDRGYTCRNKAKTVSNCTNICGDGLWVPEEACDNGNKTGCINCTISTNYTCKNALLQPSKCSSCGNYILESPEQCDNNNVKGCINCVIQLGWNCKADPRYCFRNAAVCGNKER